MSDYTPSVDEAGEVYAAWAPYGGLTSRPAGGEWDDRRAEYDRMIEAVRAEEREKAAQIAEQVKPGVDTDYEFQRGFHAAAVVAGFRIREQGKEQGS